MALTFPYSLAFFADTLRISQVTLRLQRNDEMSGSGDGRVWSTELAKPLWTADVTLSACTPEMEDALESKIDGLDGSRNTFLFANPAYYGPADGTTGLGSAVVDNIVADRSRIALSGLPAGFTVAAGEFFSITYSSGRVYFGRFCEDAVASGAGVTPNREIRPFLPLGISVGASVELVKPYFKAIIPPGGYVPFVRDMPRGEILRGGSIRVLQKP